MKHIAWLLLLLVLFLPSVARAQDEASEDDEFETNWIGLRLGVFYRPAMDMEVEVTNRPLGGIVPVVGTSLDIKRDLSVRENPHSDSLVDFDASAVLELEPFIETRFVSVYGWVVAPFEYRGDRTLTRQVSFAGATFSASTRVRSKFRQFFMGTDVAINLLNNRFVRISPLIGARAVALDWEIREQGVLGIRGDTSDIDGPLELGDFQIFPYPEVGVAIHVGYRDYIDVSLRVAGSHVDYYDVEGGTFRAELAVTAYPIPWVGIQVGGRYLEFDFQSRSSRGRNGSFDFDLEFIGATAALIVRI